MDYRIYIVRLKNGLTVFFCFFDKPLDIRVLIGQQQQFEEFLISMGL